MMKNVWTMFQKMYKFKQIHCKSFMTDILDSSESIPSNEASIQSFVTLRHTNNDLESETNVKMNIKLIHGRTIILKNADIISIKQ